MSEQTNFDYDPYLIPGTDILQNCFQTTDKEKLNLLDRQISFQRISELRLDALGCFQKAGLLQEDHIPFGASHLRRIHYYIFKDIYPFAGEYRKMDIVAKGRPPAPVDYIFKFMTHYDIEMELEMSLSNMVNSLPYRNFKEKDLYAKWLASYFERLIYIHPFREGNGRAIKEYMTEFVEYNNDKIDMPAVEIAWDKMDSNILKNITYQMTIQEDCLEKEMIKGLVYKDLDKNNTHHK